MQTTRPVQVLDLFCGGGGAAEGYVRAGWEVTGVDHSRYAVVGYPGKTIIADAVKYLREHGHEYDVIHGSPPCQGYSKATRKVNSKYVRDAGKAEPKLIPITRSLMRATGKPYIIENVVGAAWEMRSPITLCGGMFGMIIRRHRLFEVWPRIPDPLKRGHNCPNLTKIARELGIEREELSIVGCGRRAGQRDRWIKMLEIKLNPTMSRYQTKESIPPVYTHWIAEALKEIHGVGNEN